MTEASLLAPDTTSDERTWAAIAHLSTFAAYVVPFGNVIGPLVVWLIKKDESAFVAEHARQALNFQILLTLVALVGAVASLFFVGFFVLIAVAILGILFPVMATVKAGNGEDYVYPLTFDFIR